MNSQYTQHSHNRNFELTDDDINVMDKSIKRFHKQNINHFIQQTTIFKNVIENIQQNSHNLNNIDIPCMHLLSQEIELLNNQMIELNDRMNEIVYQIDKKQLVTSNKTKMEYMTMIQNRRRNEMINPFYQQYNKYMDS
jgi:hypothetical protein